MNFLDWAGLTIMLLTLIGAQFTPNDPRAESQAPSSAQVAGKAPTSLAGVAVGGEVVMLFADSGEMTAATRATVAKQNLGRAIAHYGLDKSYVSLGLRVTGSGTWVRIAYFDLPLATVTEADARLNRAESARALAERWRQALDAKLARVPSPMPATWLATTGEVAGVTMVSDSLLARSAAAALTGADGRGVRVSADSGRVILEGTVTSEAARRRVVSLMGQLPGALGVVDRLEVR